MKKLTIIPILVGFAHLSFLSRLPIRSTFNAYVISFYICVLLAISTASGCKKGGADEVDPPEPPPASFTMTVLEKTTNKPIAGATVKLEKCSVYDNQFGCRRYTTIKTLYTNSSGQVTFIRPVDHEATTIEHVKYYVERVKNSINIILTPRCVIKASIKQVKTYAPGDNLNVSLYENGCFSFLCWSSKYYLGLPKDTIAFFEGRGYSDNNIFWKINSSENSQSIYVSGFDTAKIDIDY
jgi:hypothetical protein